MDNKINKKAPDYYKAFQITNRKKIVKSLIQSGGVARFSTISKISGIYSNTLKHNLNVLIDCGIVKPMTPEGGTYSLQYYTPLLFLFTKKIPDEIVYVGLLGEKMGRKISETRVAFELLAKYGVKTIKQAYVITTLDGINSWLYNDNIPNVTWIICDIKTITDIDSIREKIEPQLIELIERYPVILDCTSLTKPATIALYQLAQKYLIPLLYIYEGEGKLKWLISIEMISSLIGISSSEIKKTI